MSRMRNPVICYFVFKNQIKATIVAFVAKGLNISEFICTGLQIVQLGAPHFFNVHRLGNSGQRKILAFPSYQE